MSQFSRDEVMMKFSEKREYNLKLAEFYRTFNGKPFMSKLKLPSDRLRYIERMSRDIENCHSHGFFIYNRANGRHKFISDTHCNNRFCPFCSARERRIVTSQIRWRYDCLEPGKYDFYFVTLTIPNVPGEQLRDSLLTFQKALYTFIHLLGFAPKKEYTKSVGVFGGLEITYNKKRNDFHPHWHLIFAVPSEWCVGGTSYKMPYIKHKITFSDSFIMQEWLDRYNYSFSEKRTFLSVDCKKVYDFVGSLPELIKYTVKSYEINSAEVLYHLHNAFFHLSVFMKRGLFAWKRDDLPDYESFMQRLRDSQKANFIQSDTDIYLYSCGSYLNFKIDCLNHLNDIYLKVYNRFINYSEVLLE